MLAVRHHHDPVTGLCEGGIIECSGPLVVKLITDFRGGRDRERTTAGVNLRTQIGDKRTKRATVLGRNVPKSQVYPVILIEIQQLQDLEHGSGARSGIGEDCMCNFPAPRVIDEICDTSMDGAAPSMDQCNEFGIVRPREAP